MTWVKVCGLTSTEAVDAAVGAGADAVGFVAHPGSPRYVPLPDIAYLADGVPVLRVLLVVGFDVSQAMAAVASTGVDAIQPYGDHAAEIVTSAIAAGLTVLRPHVAGAGLQLTGDGAIPLIDTPHPDLAGGTGEVFDWNLVSDLGIDFVLAGGLGPDNVADAVRRVRPWGVDASSGLEVEPGVKDLGKVAAFVEEAKRR